MKILHFIHDNRFFGYVNALFSTLPGVQNRFVAFIPGSAPIAHVADVPLWRRVGRGYLFSRRAREDLEWCDCLVVHYVEFWGALMMLRAPARVAAVWSGWGADYLELLPDAERRQLAPETAALARQARRRKLQRGPREAARRLVERGLSRLCDRRALLAAAARADFFSAPLEDDFDMLRAEPGLRLRARYVQLRYGSNEASRGSLPPRPTGDDILLGNSATAPNNHAEALGLLAGLDLEGRRVVVPLAYGDADYRDLVVQRGRQLLGERFEPLLEYLPLAQYNARIARCAIVLMNHRRQQGLGNIAVALCCGARVYLDEDGVMYRFFTRAGALVFGMRRLAAEGLRGIGPLEPQQQAANYAVIAGLWSEAAAVRNAMAFLDSVRAWQTASA